MSPSTPLHITRAADGGLCLRDGLDRLVAIIPPPGPDQREGSPEREDQMRCNAALFVAAAGLLAALEGTRSLLDTEIRMGSLRGSAVWAKARAIIDVVTLAARAPWAPS